MQYLKYIDYGDSASPLKVISLHGFPSIRSKQNREIAKGIADELGCRVRVVLYPGLSTSGIFSFKKTIKALVEEFPALTEGKPVGVLGHSFGGFCAILLTANFPKLINQLVLLSPLLRFNSSVSDVTGFFTAILSDSSSEVQTLTPSQLAGEFNELSKEYAVEQLIASFEPHLKVKFMQARNDGVTPTAIAKEFRKSFKSDFDFELVDQDHSFLIERPALAKKIAEFFR